MFSTGGKTGCPDCAEILVIFSAIASHIPRVSAMVSYVQDCSDLGPMKHHDVALYPWSNLSSVVDARLLVASSVQANAEEHAHEDDRV